VYAVRAGTAADRGLVEADPHRRARR
jgi:hypothetical protein